MQDIRTRYLESLKAKTPVRINLDPPRQRIANSDSPARGPANAPIEMIEFSDFQCPFCLRADPTVRQVMATYGDRIRLVYRHYPLPNHPNARPAAEASACAGEQGKFWAYHDRLFTNQSKLENTDLKEHAVSPTEEGIERRHARKIAMHPELRRESHDGNGRKSQYHGGRVVDCQLRNAEHRHEIEPGPLNPGQEQKHQREYRQPRDCAGKNVLERRPPRDDRNPPACALEQSACLLSDASEARLNARKRIDPLGVSQQVRQRAFRRHVFQPDGQNRQPAGNREMRLA